MKPSSSFTLSRSVAILNVGEPKTGKTNLMFSFPGLYILDCDMNLASAMRRAKDTKFFYDQPAVDDSGVERPTKDRWTYSIKCLKEAVANPDIKTIAIDGLGIFCEYLIAHIIDANVKAGTCKTGKMELAMWGEFARLLRDTVMFLRASGKIIFVTSHQSADKDENTGILRFTLAIPGQCKENLGGLFTDVWASTARAMGPAVKYEIRTKPTNMHVSLGTSFPLDASIDVTDKTPTAIWSLLSPKLGL